MTLKLSRLLFTALGALACNASIAETVYVSTAGNDNADGSISHPFATLNRAAQGASTKSTDTLTICVMPGDYYMQRPFEVTVPNARPIKITAAAPADKPRLIGGVRISGWEKYSDNGIYRAFVPETARFGFDFEQFFVNGRRAVLARTPNEDWFFVKGSKETPYIRGRRAAAYANQRIDFNCADWESLKGVNPAQLKNIKFRFLHKWDITHKPADYINTDSAFIYTRGEGMKPWNPITAGSRYLMYDYMAALDSPGEWCLDRDEGYIYYMPLPGENINEAECVAPTLQRLITLTGREDDPVKDIRIENISFQYSAYKMPPMGEEPAQASAFTDAAVTLEYAERIEFYNCELCHTGGYAMWMRQECHNNTIEHCYLADLGAGGIKVGEPYFRRNERPVTSHNIIHNNIITHVGRELPCGVGVAIMHSADNNVTHNEISDLYYSGVSVGWVWGYNNSTDVWTNTLNAKNEPDWLQMPITSPAVRNTIAYNHIHHIGWGELSDMGAVYTLGESEGTKVTHNVIHDVLSYDYGGWGLYTDEGSTGVEMTYNLVYRCKSGGFHQHYGKNNKIENNIFAFGHYYQAQFTRAEAHKSFSFKHNIIVQDKGATLKGDAWEKGLIDIDENLYWSINGGTSFADKYDFKQWKKLKEPHSIYADPGFADIANDDFNFKKDNAIRKIGFKPFDHSQAGVTGESEWKEKAKMSAEAIADFKIKASQRLER